LSDEGASLDGFSETQIIFSFLSTAAAFFVYFFGLQQKSKSLSGLRTLKRIFCRTTITFKFKILQLFTNCFNQHLTD